MLPSAHNADARLQGRAWRLELIPSARGLRIECALEVTLKRKHRQADIFTHGLQRFRTRHPNDWDLRGSSGSLVT